MTKRKTVMENQVSCNNCGGQTKPSKALLNSLVSFTDFGNDAGKRGTTQSRVGAAQLVDCLKCEKCGHSFVPQETSTREQAVAWWNMLLTTPQRELMTKYEVVGYGVRRPNSLTGREIEKIWQAEKIEKAVNNLKDDEYLDIQTLEVIKPNQKQFQRFNESLFIAYIDKFSDDDKIRAFEILLNRSKKWDGINNAAPFYIAICRAYNAGKQAMIDQYQAKNEGKNPNEVFISSDSYFKSEFGFI